MLVDFIEKKYNIGVAEVIPTGRMIGKRKVGGWFKTDVPQLDISAFTDQELQAMEAKGYDYKIEADRLAFAKEFNLLEDLKFIPHSWVEIRGEILDPTGFYKDGMSGQFDQLIKSKANLQARYMYFSNKAKVSEAVGRITKQNQTKDVGPNEIKKQAAKFGFKVNKDGYPPLLNSAAVKNTTPNKLMNLGLG